MKNNLARSKSISSIKVVETKNSWKSFSIVVVIFLGVLAAFSYFTYQLGGQNGVGTPASSQLSELKQQVEKLDSEREKLSSTANSADSELNIERATQKQLATQVQTLTAENSKLKEDLAFFENLIPSENGPRSLRIGAFKAEVHNQSQIQYRVLAMQGGKNVPDFVGEIQLVATVLQGNKTSTITYPEASSGEAGKLKLSFKYYQRLDGTITLPEGATIKTLQARIMNKGQIRTYQSINF